MDELRKQLVPLLKQNNIEFAGVFGSVARGEDKPESDIDLLVRFSKPLGLFELVGVEQNLSEQLRKKVDLVTERALCKHVKHRVLKDLIVLYGEQAR